MTHHQCPHCGGTLDIIFDLQPIQKNKEQEFLYIDRFAIVKSPDEIPDLNKDVPMGLIYVNPGYQEKDYVILQKAITEVLRQPSGVYAGLRWGLLKGGRTLWPKTKEALKRDEIFVTSHRYLGAPARYQKYPVAQMDEHSKADLNPIRSVSTANCEDPVLCNWGQKTRYAQMSIRDVFVFMNILNTLLNRPENFGDMQNYMLTAKMVYEIDVNRAKKQLLIRYYHSAQMTFIAFEDMEKYFDELTSIFTLGAKEQ